MTDRDCKHGTLARQCDRCELEGEVERLRAFVAAWDASWKAKGIIFAGERDAYPVMKAREAIGDIK